MAKESFKEKQEKIRERLLPEGLVFPIDLENGEPPVLVELYVSPAKIGQWLSDYCEELEGFGQEAIMDCVDQLLDCFVVKRKHKEII